MAIATYDGYVHFNFFDENAKQFSNYYSKSVKVSSTITSSTKALIAQITDTMLIWVEEN